MGMGATKKSQGNVWEFTVCRELSVTLNKLYEQETCGTDHT